MNESPFLISDNYSCNAVIPLAISLMDIPKEIIREGWAQKQGHKVKNWKKRFMVLTLGSLVYFKERSDVEPTGVFPITFDSKFEAVDLDDGSHENCLVLETPMISDQGRSYELIVSLPSEDELGKWMDAAEKAKPTEETVIFKRGVLQKKSRGRRIKFSFAKNWQKRYFAVTKGNLWYFKSQDDSLPAGVIHLGKTTTVNETEDSEKRNSFALSTHTSGEFRGEAEVTESSEKYLYMCADTIKERKEWMEAIREAIVSDEKGKEENDIAIESLRIQSVLAEKLAEERKKKERLLESGVIERRIPTDRVVREKKEKVLVVVEEEEDVEENIEEVEEEKEEKEEKEEEEVAKSNIESSQSLKLRQKSEKTLPIFCDLRHMDRKSGTRNGNVNDKIPENIRKTIQSDYGLHLPQNELYVGSGRDIPVCSVDSLCKSRLEYQLGNDFAVIGPAACWAEVERHRSIRILSKELYSLCKRERIPVPRQIFQRFLFDMSMRNDLDPTIKVNPVLNYDAHLSRELSRGLLEECTKRRIKYAHDRVSRVCNSLGRSVREEMKEISRSVDDFLRDRNIYSYEVEWKETGDTVRLSFCGSDHELHIVMITKLRSLFEKSIETITKYHRISEGDKERLFRWRLFAMVQRYRCLGTDGDSDGRGYHAALSDHIFRFLHNELSTQIECFASPINCFFSHFCSAFADTDCWFGSLGTFFHVDLIEGSFEWNPPFFEDIIEEGAKRLLSAFKGSSRPLSVVIILPNWIEPPTPGIQMFEGDSFAEYRRIDITRPKGNQDIWIDGFQRTSARRYFKSNWAGRIFIMQNELGAVKWPIKPDFVDRLLHLFQHGELPPQIITKNITTIPVAYATLIMYGDEYVAGAATLAWSLKQHGTGAAIICLVTEDVSSDARKGLSGVFDYVIDVPYITAEAIQRRSRRFSAKFYDKWLDSCFTKFSILNPSLGYSHGVRFEKIAFFDADMVAVAPCDSLFEVPAPAGICSAVPPEEEDSYHGKRVPVELVEKSLEGYGFRGCLLLIEPNEGDFRLVMRILSKGKYGDPKSMIGPDELLATRLFASKWNHVHRRYGVTAWKTKGVEPVVLHFVSEKPWAPETAWDDFQIWNKAAESLLADESVGANLAKFFPSKAKRQKSD